jgi:aminoglycoside 3-N-acetyltransferase
LLLRGDCRARRVGLADVLAAAERMIVDDPAALLCGDDIECRCQAALQQRLETLGGLRPD